ncbi:M56 family metallopeptidase [Clostridium sp. ASF356]|nr:M56 family metallopeptidase [Clostridium sp. MD294]USF31059.1 hypothetical protein C820_002505 [Clostridium sp. MD294]
MLAVMASICGFMFSIVYFLLARFVYQTISSKLIIMINIIAVCSFLIPFCMILFIPEETEVFFGDYNIVVMLSNEWECFVFEKIHDFIQYINIIWLLGVIFFLFLNIYEYITFVQKLKKKSFHIQDDTWEIIIEKVTKKWNCNKKVHIVGNPEIFEPCVVGIKEHYIIIPAKLIDRLTAEEIELILSHEFFHIKHNDALLNFLMVLLTSFHWFNPIFYFLRQNLYEYIEINCDEAVTHDFDEEKKMLYCKLIVKIIEESKQYKKWKSYVVCIGGSSKKEYFRRIECIMSKKRKGNIVKNVAVLTVACAWLFESTAIAKNMDFTIRQLFSNRVDITNAETTEIILGLEIPEEEVPEVRDASYIEPIPENQLIVEDNPDISYKLFFEDGTSIPYYGAEMEESRASHVHTLKNTTATKHTKLKDGSCETKYYEARYCVDCGMVFYDKLIETVTKNPCNH